MMNKKRKYVAPRMKVVAVAHRARLLSDSDPETFEVIIVPRP